MSSGDASAQVLQKLLTIGDTLPGLNGTLSDIVDIDVNDSGQWFAHVTTDFIGIPTEVALVDGVPILVEGHPLADPPGTAVESFGELVLGNDGVRYWIVTTDAPIKSNEVLFRNLIKISQEGSDVFDPNQPPGTIWKAFVGFDLNDNGDLLVAGDLDTPAVAGLRESALVLQTFDVSGSLATEDVLLLGGDPIAGSSLLVKDVGENSAANDIAHSNDHWIAYVKNSGSTFQDEMIMLDGVVIAQEGSSGPDPLMIWKKLRSTKVDVTNDGHYVFIGTLNDLLAGTSLESIFVDSQVFLTQGDTSPSIAPYAFDKFSSGGTPIQMTANGSVFFYGSTDNPEPSQDDGYFLNDQMLLQEGKASVDGIQVTGIGGFPNGFRISSNGRFVIALVTSAASEDVLVLLDLGLVQVMSSATLANATLAHTEGIPLINAALTFQMDGEQDLGVTPFLLISSEPAAGWFSTGTGLLTSIGEILIDFSPSLGNPVAVVAGPPSDFSPVDFSIVIPDDVALAGRDFFAQGVYWDIGDMSPQENFRLTNGLQITVGE